MKIRVRDGKGMFPDAGKGRKKSSSIHSNCKREEDFHQERADSRSQKMLVTMKHLFVSLPH